MRRRAAGQNRALTHTAALSPPLGLEATDELRVRALHIPLRPAQVLQRALAHAHLVLRLSQLVGEVRGDLSGGRQHVHLAHRPERARCGVQVGDLPQRELQRALLLGRGRRLLRRPVALPLRVPHPLLHLLQRLGLLSGQPDAAGLPRFAVCEAERLLQSPHARGGVRDARADAQHVSKVSQRVPLLAQRF